jgi:erythronate-4-phosphate dehydrogenase
VGEYFTAAMTWLETRKGFPLGGKTLGIIGHGHVGKQVERKAKALGMRVLKCDPPLLDAGGGDPSLGYIGLETLLAQSDVVTLHVPLTEDGSHPTLRLADATFFAKTTRPIVLLNTCRGEVIDDDALTAALDAGRIRHLVLDVFSGEPRVNQAIAARADLISPHIAGYSLQGKLNGTTQVAAAFRRHFGFDTRWSPVFPAPPQPEIAYMDALSDNAFLQHCVATAYDLAADDKRFRDSFQEADAAKAFDRLRRDYPIRHEFSSYAILRLPEGKRELGFRLRDLGFQVA